MKILGIDPGMSGGIACLYVDTFNGGVTAETWKMPETEKDVWDLFEQHKSFLGHVTHAYIEDVHAMPGQGVTSMFKFGYGLGGLRMALIGHGIPFEKVAPGRWQRSLGCLSGGDKNITKRKAQELYPTIRVTHANADALLIATYGMRLALRPATEQAKLEGGI